MSRIRKCVVKGCVSTNKDCRFFSWPADEDLAAKWRKSLGIPTNQHIAPHNTYVCRLHFADDLVGKMRLIKGAVPTLNISLCCNPTTSRVNKRSGYHYKLEAAHEPTQGYYDEEDINVVPIGHEIPSSPSHATDSHSYDEYRTSSPSAPPLPSYKSSHSHVGSSSTTAKQQAGHSIGSGLRSIAQGSANQAYTAVANQHAAAKQAAYIAQNTLAQAASQAAATAQAALAGKRVLLQELEQQSAEAQRSLSRELEQFKAAKITAQLAKQTAQAANQHVSILTAAVNNAKSVAEQANQAANEVENQLASQSSMVGQAKSRYEQVEEQLKQARVDFEATKEAALKAASSAAEAQVNASKAAAHATIGLHESTNHDPPSGESIEQHSYDEINAALEHEMLQYDEAP